MIFRTLPHPSRTVSSQSHASSCHIPTSLCRPVTHPIDLFLYTIGNNHNTTSAVGERSLDLLEVAALELARDVLRLRIDPPEAERAAHPELELQPRDLTVGKQSLSGLPGISTLGVGIVARTPTSSGEGCSE